MKERKVARGDKISHSVKQKEQDCQPGSPRFLAKCSPNEKRVNISVCVNAFQVCKSKIEK